MRLLRKRPNDLEGNKRDNKKAKVTFPDGAVKIKAERMSEIKKRPRETRKSFVICYFFTVHFKEFKRQNALNFHTQNGTFSERGTPLEISKKRSDDLPLIFQLFLCSGFLSIFCLSL